MYFMYELHRKPLCTERVSRACFFIIVIIIHWTHYLFSDWLKAHSEFTKSAPVTSYRCRLYNNHVKDQRPKKRKIMCNHVIYDLYLKYAWFPRVISSNSCAWCCLLSVKKPKKISSIYVFVHCIIKQLLEKTRSC